MVRRVAFAVPGDLATPTGGYAYDRRMIAELEKLGWTVEVIDLGDGFPWPGDDTKATARRLLLAVPEGQTIIIDGLALGVLPEAAHDLRARNPLVALVHHPLALETGLSAAKARDLRASERSALSAVRRVIDDQHRDRARLTADYAVAVRASHGRAARQRSGAGGEWERRWYRSLALGRGRRAAQGL